jgi:hypothetical protein
VDRATHPSKLFELALRRETGLLVATSKTVGRSCIVDGAHVHNFHGQEWCWQQLVARSLVLPMGVDMAVALCPRYGGASVMPSRLVCAPRELFRALVARPRTIHRPTGGMGASSFCWACDRRRNHLARASPFELIARGVLTGYDAEEIDSILAPTCADIRLPPTATPSSRNCVLALENGVLSAVREIARRTSD